MNAARTNWIPVLEVVHFAFQPIVNAQNGQVFGYEALLRNWEGAGFASIQDLFDTAAQDDSLIELDEWLRLKVIGTFLTSGFPPGTKLFYNVDNRLFQYPEYSAETFARKLEEAGFPKDSFFIEISENHKLGTSSQIRQFISHHREHHIRIALDDFGVGYSGLQVLFEMDPDMIKLDRYFIAGVDKDPKKRLFVQHLVEMSHVLGIQVIAEGVETESEFFACREIGCDLVQGYGIQRPFNLTADSSLVDSSPVVCRLIQQHKRGRYAFTDQIMKQVHPVRAFRYTDSIESVLHYFKENTASPHVPIVNLDGEPLGIVREKDFKGYLYSPFGYELLKNKNLSIRSFIQTVPVIDLHSRLEKFLEVFALAADAETLLVTDGGRYIGCLSQSSLLRLIHEKELREARDQNPLTRMRGNMLVNEYLQETLSDPLHEGLYAYFDFDYFKPYNDTYGFRQGDRVILLFSDILREYEQMEGWFVGHIGGDDFFAGIPLRDGVESILQKVRDLIRKFSQDVSAFYEPEDRTRGYIRARDRNGKFRKFPLLGVSAAIIGIRSGRGQRNMNVVSKLLGALKKKAKESSDGIAFLWLTDASFSLETVEDPLGEPSKPTSLSIHSLSCVL